ncbi:hypothetical protein J3Q64DRAFT_1477080 [Phycomyces blakesleeanus]|uniref:Uncharacterized protein n=1 Tax=Phycomyces blakesleeanus TaxID=4837 RepID=A0ABR3B1B3_PHYBL
MKQEREIKNGKVEKEVYLKYFGVSYLGIKRGQLWSPTMDCGSLYCPSPFLSSLIIIIIIIYNYTIVLYIYIYIILVFIVNIFDYNCVFTVSFLIKEKIYSC